MKQLNPFPEKENSRHQLAIYLGVIDGTIGFPTFIVLDKDYNILNPKIRGVKTANNMMTFLQYINDK